MNRSRRGAVAKPFVSAGVYDPTAPFRNPTNPNLQPAVAPPAAAAPLANQNWVQSSPASTPQKKGAPVIPVSPTVPNVAVAASNNDSEHTADNISMESGDDGSTGGSKPFFKKIFGIRKKPSIRAKERKIRQNRRLRKILLPKNALMALHEVKGIKMSDFIINNALGGGFTSIVSVNNIQYEGHGSSKNSAKNSCCEKALRDLIIHRMLNTKPLKSESTDNLNAEAKSEDAEGDSDMKDLDENGDTEGADDDVPMINLASYALYKLFSEWENEGFEVPEFHPSAANAGGTPSENGGNAKEEKPKKPPTIRSELPANWETMHPATLLCMMRPGISYIDCGTSGEKPNCIQKIGVTVDEQQFIGSGRSKKLARKDAAVNVCNKLFGTNFVNEQI